MAILRAALWSLVAILALYVFTATLPDSPVAAVVTGELLFLLTKVALATLALGAIAALVEKLWKERPGKCQTCGRSIPPKAIFCRLHLNQVLEEEDLRRRTMNVKLPE